MSSTKYLRFSNTQKKVLQDIANKMGRVYKGKFVIYNGVKREYTEMLEESSVSLYSDSELVASGDPDNMKLINEGDLL